MLPWSCLLSESVAMQSTGTGKTDQTAKDRRQRRVSALHLRAGNQYPAMPSPEPEHLPGDIIVGDMTLVIDSGGKCIRV